MYDGITRIPIILKTITWSEITWLMSQPEIKLKFEQSSVWFMLPCTSHCRLSPSIAELQDSATVFLLTFYWFSVGCPSLPILISNRVVKVREIHAWNILNVISPYTFVSLSSFFSFFFPYPLSKIHQVKWISQHIYKLMFLQLKWTLFSGPTIHPTEFLLFFLPFLSPESSECQ